MSGDATSSTTGTPASASTPDKALANLVTQATLMRQAAYRRPPVAGPGVDSALSDIGDRPHRGRFVWEAGRPRGGACYAVPGTNHQPGGNAIMVKRVTAPTRDGRSSGAGDARGARVEPADALRKGCARRPHRQGRLGMAGSLECGRDLGQRVVQPLCQDVVAQPGERP